ncbi:MAG TPA: SRPBCC domain-containing protein [Terriglobales bacterium]|nr:SRPBCC domain-containing protein [Terriglobales bacterium]
MSSVAVTPNQDALVSEIHVAAPPERVFQALIDQKQVMQWWTSDECQIESFSLEPRKGGRWIYDTKASKLIVNGVSQFHCEGEVLEYDPPRVLSYTWIANWHDRPLQRTVVRWELASSKGGTLVRVTHSGLAELPIARRDYAGGWPGVLEDLKRFVESAPQT